MVEVNRTHSRAVQAGDGSADGGSQDCGGEFPYADLRTTAEGFLTGMFELSPAVAGMQFAPGRRSLRTRRVGLLLRPSGAPLAADMARRNTCSSSIGDQRLLEV
jgi:hypothetical protein